MTVYTIRNNGIEFRTTNPQTAEEMSKRGARVTAKRTPESGIVSDEYVNIEDMV